MNEWSVPIGFEKIDQRLYVQALFKGGWFFAHKVTRAGCCSGGLFPWSFDGFWRGWSLWQNRYYCKRNTGTAKISQNPTTRVVYGQSDDGFTAVSTAPSTAVGDILEVVDFVSSAAVAVKYITVTADMIG